MSMLPPSEFASPFETSPTRGLSPEAGRVESLLAELRKQALASVVLGKAKQDALDSLYTIFCEGCRAGWDGYGASPASYESYLRARRFIEALPADFPVPDIALDPDGEVSLEWYHAPGRIFSVSVGANDELNYAGRFSPTRKTHGTEPFTGHIPKMILDNIRRLLQ